MSDIVKLTSDLQSARESYLSAQQRASFARNEETDALNRLNAAQKALEKVIQELRQSSPPASDWAKGEYKRMGM